MMDRKRCLYCYTEIESAEQSDMTEYHKSCSRKFFGKAQPPTLNYAKADMLKLGEQVIKSQSTVTGVQPKLSLGIQKAADSPGVYRFTIVGLWGKYILKPPTELYPNLPEIEDLTMHLAKISKIKTVDHTLIRLTSGELAYLTKRIDRVKNKKLHMEDMCQLTERLTEHKYKGSYEQIAKAIRKYSVNPGLDVINFYEIVLFCFLTGNNDMHLKNFSLLKSIGIGYNLCPAYDLLASELLVEDDDEELALTLNGKKKKLNKEDFLTAMRGGGMNEKSIENIFKKFGNLINSWHQFVDVSFLDQDFKEKYHEMIDQKSKHLELKTPF